MNGLNDHVLPFALRVISQRASCGWALGESTSMAIWNRLRVVFGVRDAAGLTPAQLVAALDLLRTQQDASMGFLQMMMELRDWFNRAVAGGGEPWTPAIKARLTRQLKARVVLPEQVDWKALARGVRS